MTVGGMGGVDRRRNLGPELSVQPLIKGTGEPQILLDGEYARSDGRYPEQLRSLCTTFLPSNAFTLMVW